MTLLVSIESVEKNEKIYSGHQRFHSVYYFPVDGANARYRKARNDLERACVWHAQGR